MITTIKCLTITRLQISLIVSLQTHKSMTGQLMQSKIKILNNNSHNYPNNHYSTNHFKISLINFKTVIDKMLGDFWGMNKINILNNIINITIHSTSTINKIGINNITISSNNINTIKDTIIIKIKTKTKEVSCHSSSSISMHLSQIRLPLIKIIINQ